MEKKHYFSLSNRKDKIEKWLSISRESKSHLPFELNLNKAALLVLDMQNYFLDRNSHAHIPSVGTIIPTIQKLISFMKIKSRPIIFTKHISSDKSDDLMLRWWKDNITRDNELSEITSFIEIDKGITVIKSKYSAFSSPQFTKLIKESSIKQLLQFYYQTEQMISPPIPIFLACLSVIIPFDVERIFIPYPFKT